MKKYLFLFTVTVGILLTFQTYAKVWRINNTPGVTADFTTGALALASASVVNDDTLYFEASSTATPHTGFTLTKRLVLIGTGYFISGANSNSGLQANSNSSYFGNASFYIDSTASGSTFIGLDYFTIGNGPTLGAATDNITVTRCHIYNMNQVYGISANQNMTGWKINKNYFDAGLNLNVFTLLNWEVTNNIINGALSMNNTNNLNNLIRNNVLRSNIDIYSAYFSNNIITSSTFTNVNVTIKNNISSGTNLPAGNGNVNSQPDASVFQGISANSTDGQWRLKAGSPAIAAGETISTITPDCGAFGTADPYRLSGIPAIPTIYLLTVPASVASNATTMPITVSTKSNN